jgi:biotin carboxylase
VGEGRGNALSTLLFVGAGRHQRRAIRRVRELGHRVVAIDRNPEALGFREADEAELVDFADLGDVIEVARRRGVDGVMTVAADRAVPVVAAVAEELGLAGIGTETARRMTHKGEMRGAFANAGVPQPPFALLRSAHDSKDAVLFPAVLKPADSGGQRAVFRIESESDLERHLEEALAESPSRTAILEEFVDGVEMNGIVVVRERVAEVLTLSDRLRPPGLGFGVGWLHIYPPSINSGQLSLAQDVAADAVRALGMQDGIAFPQLIAAPDGRVVVVEIAARIPGGQMADLVNHAVGVDLVQVAVLQALGEDVPDEVALPRFSQPLAIRFFTAQPGPLPTGRVARIGALEPLLAAEGVVQAETYLEVGETIRPVRRDGDRRGYVIAVAETSEKAVRRADAAAQLLTVEIEP